MFAESRLNSKEVLVFKACHTSHDEIFLINNVIKRT